MNYIQNFQSVSHVPNTAALPLVFSCLSLLFLTTICNTRARNFQNTNNCTYKPLWGLAWRWFCIWAETCS